VVAEGLVAAAVAMELSNGGQRSAGTRFRRIGDAAAYQDAPVAIDCKAAQ